MTFTEFLKRFLLVLLVLLLWVGLWTARSTLLLGFAAAVIAVGISIPSRALQRRGWRRAWAIGASVLGVGIVAMLLLLFVLPTVALELVNLLSSIPDALSSFMAQYETLRNSSALLRAALPQPIFVSADLTTIDPARAKEVVQQLLDASLVIAPSLLGGIGVMMAVVINLIFVFFIAIFFLVDPQSYVKATLYLLPSAYHARVIGLWNELYRELKLWISALFLSISITTVLVWLILGVLLGMPNAIVVAVFAGVATFVPNVGVFLPLIPITIFTLANDPAQLVIMVPVYLLIQLVESNILTPSIIKAELEIPAGALMLFQLLVTLAFGALGLLLAVPIFVVLLVLARELYAYDLLGLRHTTITIGSNAKGEFTMTEATTPPSTVANTATLNPTTTPAVPHRNDDVNVLQKQLFHEQTKA